MDEQLYTAQTSEEPVAQVEQTEEQSGTAVTGEQQTEPQEQTNDAEFKDGNDQPAKEPQSKERNAEEARKRREAEKQEAIKKARMEAVLEATDGVNPFTGQPMKDAEDVEEYLTMRQIKKEGKDPVADYAAYAKEKARAQKAEQEQREQQNEKVRNDIAAFREAHPDVDVKTLFADEDFSDYAEGKLGSKPLTDIYAGYQKLVGKTRQEEQHKAAQALANSRATPGPAATAGNQDDALYTKEQVKAMSQGEVHANWEKIVKSMEKWNT